MRHRGRQRGAEIRPATECVESLRISSNVADHTGLAERLDEVVHLLALPLLSRLGKLLQAGTRGLLRRHLCRRSFVREGPRIACQIEPKLPLASRSDELRERFLCQVRHGGSRCQRGTRCSAMATPSCFRLPGMIYVTYTSCKRIRTPHLYVSSAWTMTEVSLEMNNQQQQPGAMAPTSHALLPPWAPAPQGRPPAVPPHL